MSNIIEYVQKMKDDSFQTLEFNEVDGLVLSQLAYLDFSPLEMPVKLSEIKDKRTIHLLADGTWHYIDNLNLMTEASNSTRFGPIQIIDSKNISTTDYQFSATTFQLNQSTYFIAYRGTSPTVVGWKENFYMSYQENIPSHFSAVKYFEEMIENYPGDYILGGHSKGGNLATYAGLFSNDDAKASVKTIYSYDGPGFHQSLIENIEDSESISKIHKLVPEFTIIGSFLDEGEKYKIVKSDGKRIYQHNPFTWKIDHTNFTSENEISFPAYLSNQIISSWLQSLDKETKKDFLASINEIVEATGVERIEDLKDFDVEDIKHVMLRILNSDKEKRKEFGFVIKVFMKIAVSETIDLMKEEKDKNKDKEE